MTATFQYKPIKIEPLSNVNGDTNLLHKVKWQLIASLDEKIAISEFTHMVTFKQLTSITDEQIMTWILDEIHPSDLNAMRAGLAARVAGKK